MQAVVVIHVRDTFLNWDCESKYGEEAIDPRNIKKVKLIGLVMVWIGRVGKGERS